MSILVRFPSSSMTTDQYEAVKKQVSDGHDFPPDVSEIWSSREQFEAFGERLMPAIQAAGLEVGGEPEILEVYSQVSGG